VDNFECLGVRSIYPWQSSCLLGKGFLEGTQNLIYTAPTGGGKSLVADVLMLKRVIENPGKKAILVLPYVALVQEKLKWLRSLVSGIKKRVDETNQTHLKRIEPMIQVMGFLGGSRSRITWNDFDIAVCTIEKANALVNSAIEDGKINQLGILVMDELHMLEDEGRGYIMELMATKLACCQHGIQIVGMSATLSNPKLLADWLQAKFYVSKYRPIPIEEHLVYDNAIYPTANAKEFFRTASQLSGRISATQKPVTPCAIIDKSMHNELENPVTNAVVALSAETALAGFGALVFCGSRMGVERMAALIADSMPAESSTPLMKEEQSDLITSLRALPNGYEDVFNKTIAVGVGFHHAGLTVEERDLVADAYDKGTLKVMVATCSLAAGINLPARRVILHGARMGRDLVGPAMLRQMRGRAGRKGKDEVGETYLCCVKTDLEDVAELLEAEIPPVTSCLTPEKRGIKRSILEVIATRLANSRLSLEEYIRSSLLWQTLDHSSVMGMLELALDELVRDRLIHETSSSYEPTQVGCAIVASALTPEDGLFVHAEMQRALASFVMESEMHSLYLFTPIPSISQPVEIQWPMFRDHVDLMSEADLRAFSLIGVSPAVVNRLALSGGSLPETTASEAAVARTYRRAYVSLQLRDLCNEVPIRDIALRYGVPRGQVQNLAQTCHGFAAGMIKFCERMGSSFSLLGAVLEHMLDRLRAGARADLLEMAQVTFVKSRMARLFWENGFKSVRMLAEARVEDLVPVMMLAQKRWKVKHDQEATAKLQEKVKAKAEVIVNSASRIWERMMLVELDE
jgi:replicative superfamily II helicase